MHILTAGHDDYVCIYYLHSGLFSWLDGFKWLLPQWHPTVHAEGNCDFCKSVWCVHVLVSEHVCLCQGRKSFVVSVQLCTALLYGAVHMHVISFRLGRTDCLIRMGNDHCLAVLDNSEL